MADKSLETDESFNDSKYQPYNDFNNYNESAKTASVSSPPPPVQQKETSQIHNLNVIQEKVLADEANNKICPMCGKLFDCAVVPFASFCEHVEDHFRDDSIDLVHNMENNFELISHTVGDF